MKVAVLCLLVWCAIVTIAYTRLEQDNEKLRQHVTNCVTHVVR